MARTATLFAVLTTPVLTACGGERPACETRETGLGEQRWVLECETAARASEANLVASYYDPQWTAELPSSVHIYCSDRGPTFAWNPGVRATESSDRWREKAVFRRVDGGRRIQDRWMVSADAEGRPTYFLFGDRAASLVNALREGRELLLETTIDRDEEPTLRLVTLVGLQDALGHITCFSDD